MRKLIYFLLVFQISISAKAQLPAKLKNYQMKSIAIQTRWAKNVKPNNALKEYPRPQLERRNWINLNGLWDYKVADSTTETVSQYDGKILVPYPLESALSGVKKSLQPDHVIWYHRTFDKPALNTREKLLLNFGAISWKATVYLNDIAVGEHSGSYTAFSLDITDMLKKGQNHIKIKVSNPLERGIGPRGKQTLTPGSMWYSPSSGIWQTVWLERVPENYIKSIKVTPDVNKGVLKLVVNASAVIPAKVEISVKVPACGKCKILKQVREGDRINITLKVPNAKLWSPDSPHLYDLEITLGKDKVKSYFGMRKVEIKKDEKGIDRIFLNDKYTYNLGVLDQGFWPDGLYTAPTDEALKFDIEVVKWMGFNTIRKHIKVEPARWYYHADKLGILVWQDLVQPGGKFGAPNLEVKFQFEKESAEILEQFNHYPCITTYVLFNEGWGSYDQDRLTNWIKKADPTRLINGHSGASIVNGKLENEQIKDVVTKSINSDMTDIHSYPPPAIPNHVPGKAMVLGEFGGIGMPVMEHLWDDTQFTYSYGKIVRSHEILNIYEKMIDSLIKFEKCGLSASIYTQPFDVEGEQNGIITYDREIVKIPFTDLRKLHGKLLPSIKYSSSRVKQPLVKPVNPIRTDFAITLQAYKGGVIDSITLRTLALFGSAENDLASKRGLTFANDYFKVIKDPLCEANIKFIKRFIRSTSDFGFKIIYDNIEIVNSILGPDEAEAMITYAIEQSEIKPITDTKKPDWSALQENLASRYGEIGKEIVLQANVFYTYNKKQWPQFVACLIPWFEKYGYKRKWIGTYFINSFAWGAFSHVSDLKSLNSILKITTHGLTLDPQDAMLMDTHANLLHKVGRTLEAIKWQEKAIELNPTELMYLETLKKMKEGKPTWSMASKQAE